MPGSVKLRFISNSCFLLVFFIFHFYNAGNASMSEKSDIPTVPICCVVSHSPDS